MTNDQQQVEEIVINIAQAIYRSTIIPESHKKAYVDYILDHGLTEKMITELRKVFEQEKSALEMDLQEKQKVVEGLQKLIQEEQASIDQNQAEMLVAFDDYNERKLAELQSGLEEIETKAEHELEEAGEEEEEKEEEAIRVKLGVKKEK